LQLQKDFESWGFDLFDQFSQDQFIADYIESGQKSDSGNEAGATGQVMLDSITFTGTLRADTSWGVILPSLGVSSQTENDWNYFAHFSTGYHPPSLTQKYSRGGYQGNASLIPERSEEFDIGFEKKHSWGELKFEGFQRTMSDLIENRTTTVGGQSVLSPQNAGRAAIYGFELKGLFLLKGLSPSFDSHLGKLEGGITYQQGQNITLSRALLFTPQWQGHLTWLSDFSSVWSMKVQGTSWANYYDLDSNNSLVSLGPWTTIDILTSWNFVSSFYLKFTAANIFDAQREFSYGYPEAQRNFKLTLSYQD
jgi:outer membrane cobalamin receptor